MQELVEMIRSDHAHLHHLVAYDPPAAALPALRAHAELLDAVVAPLVESLDDPAAATEWQRARGRLDDAIGAAGADDPTELRRATDDHAEQMEQVVLARLLSEADEEAVAEQTARAMERHEALGLGTSRPAAMRASDSRLLAEDPHPAGSDGDAAGSAADVGAEGQP